MTPSTCCFCNHQNPERAKFCNECASPLHLRPCGSCNAVNARGSETCHRCGAALSSEATTDAMPQRIVAEADATLATLKRELVATAAVEGGVAPLAMADQGFARETVVPAEASDVPPLVPPTSDDRVIFAPAEPRFTTTSAADAVDAALAVRPGEREWRPERRSRGFAFAAVFALLVLPVTVYVIRNPEQVDAWLERLSPPVVVESSDERAAATASPPPPLPAAQLPASTPAAATAGTQPSDTANVAQPAQAEQAVRGTGDEATQEATLPASPAFNVVAPGASPPEAPAAAAVAAPTKAASKSASRTSASKSRARERATKGRSQPPPAAQRSGATTEPCTDAMVAVGLCSR